MKPLKYPGDKDPANPAVFCTMCGARMESPNADSDSCASKICPSCGADNSSVVTGLNPCHPDTPGKKTNPFSVQQDGLVYNRLSSEKNNKLVEANINKKIKKKIPRVKDEFMSEEFHQCPDLNERKPAKPADNYNDEIMQSCEDLAIDG